LPVEKNFKLQELDEMKRFATSVLILAVTALLLPGLLGAQDVKTLVDRGIANLEQGRLDQALNDFNQALKLKPNDASLYDWRGVAYRTKGQNDLALKDFDQAIQLDPRLAKAYRDRAMVYDDKTDYAKAVADLEKAQSLGYKVDQDFLKMVKRKAAEKQ
jgi:Flp pilus assembly protein TadD